MSWRRRWGCRRARGWSTSAPARARSLWRWPTSGRTCAWRPPTRARARSPSRAPNARAAGARRRAARGRPAGSRSPARSTPSSRNPPYVPDGERELAPESGLRAAPTRSYAGRDGLDVYRRLVRRAARGGVRGARGRRGPARPTSRRCSTVGYDDRDRAPTSPASSASWSGAAMTPPSRRQCHRVRRAWPSAACVFPADTVYGLACDPANEAAVARLYELKGRPPDKPAAVMFFDRVHALAALPELRRARARCWRGCCPAP